MRDERDHALYDGGEAGVAAGIFEVPRYIARQRRADKKQRAVRVLLFVFFHGGEGS
jgi:hypothetical protein